MNNSPLLSIRNLTITFPQPGGKTVYPVVCGLDLDLYSGQTMGLAGESGSGKSLSALAILGMVPNPGSVSGSIKFRGQELIGLSTPEYQSLRGSKIAIVFQDPSTALNPVLTIEEQLVETLLQHKTLTRTEARCQAIESLKKVDIPSPEKRLGNYPHQLSGGMKQRVLIAMALSCEPDILILDEPTTALDVTIQAQILDIVELIQRMNNTSILLISHDLSIISEISDSMSVMYSGYRVESGKTETIINSPKHPYTSGLIHSIPKLNEYKTRLSTIPGSQPNPAERPGGCPFHPRCSNVIQACRIQYPDYIIENEHGFACWNPKDSV
jgi:oligopeptide/dipeptide ABC transporter ATP-binding protein